MERANKLKMSSSGSQLSAASSTHPRCLHDLILTHSLLLVNADDDSLKLQEVAEIFDYPITWMDRAWSLRSVSQLCV